MSNEQTIEIRHVPPADVGRVVQDFIDDGVAQVLVVREESAQAFVVRGSPRPGPPGVSLR